MGSLSIRDPVPLGKYPHIDADWVVVCTRPLSCACYVSLKIPNCGSIFLPAAVCSRSQSARV
jgi:hypothetical protein